MHPYTYIIHLKRRTDRYELFLKSWEAAGLSTERLIWYDAVDGRTLPDAAFASFKGVSKIRNKLAGQLGCYLSHVNAIQKAIDSEHFPLLILEDDAVITGPVDLSAIIESTPPDARLLYLGGLPVRGRARAKIETQGFQHLGDIRMYGGHAYVLPNRSAAEHVLAHLRKYQTIYDSSLVRYQKLHPAHVYAYSPFLFHQAHGLSDIDGTLRWKSNS